MNKTKIKKKKKIEFLKIKIMEMMHKEMNSWRESMMNR